MTDKIPVELAKDSAATEPGPDEKRRKLLRASMSLPFVASLQTSTTYANASAFQCAAEADDAALSQDGFIDATEPSDGFVRVSVCGYRYIQLDSSGDPTTTTKWFWDVTQNTGTCNATLAGGTELYAEADATVLTVDSTDTTKGSDGVNVWQLDSDTSSGRDQKQALVIYDPDAPDYLHISLVSNTDPYFPKFKIVQNNQIGMPHSCLCSVTGGNATVC